MAGKKHFYTIKLSAGLYSWKWL